MRSSCTSETSAVSASIVDLVRPRDDRSRRRSAHARASRGLRVDRRRRCASRAGGRARTAPRRCRRRRRPRAAAAGRSPRRTRCRPASSRNPVRRASARPSARRPRRPRRRRSSCHALESGRRRTARGTRRSRRRTAARPSTPARRRCRTRRRLRISPSRTALAALGDVRLDAAAGDGAEHPPRACHRQLRAERARGAAACRDDGRDRDVLACGAPFLRFREHVVHRVLMVVMDALAELLIRVDAGELGDPLPVLAYVAGQAVELDDERAERCAPPCAAARRGRRRSAPRARGRRPRRQGARHRSLHRRPARAARPEHRRARPARARARERPRGGAVPRRGRRSRLAPLLPRAARRGARRMTPAVQAAKRAGIDFTLHEYEGVELGDGDYAVGGREGARPAAGAALQDARRIGRRPPLRVRRARRPPARPARGGQAGDPRRPRCRRSARPAM